MNPWEEGRQRYINALERKIEDLAQQLSNARVGLAITIAAGAAGWLLFLFRVLAEITEGR